MAVEVLLPHLTCAALRLQVTAAATAALAPRIAQLMNSRLAAATATVNVYFHLIKKDDGAA
jgi:phenylpyruvate tautomerase PptA (4-oxalocrotonate tautomerase family)